MLEYVIMGFIERLEQYEEAEALARSQREAELSRKRAAEIALHGRRRLQAGTVYKDSGVIILVRELRKFLGLFDVYGAGQHNSSYDPDSVCQAIKWDERKTGVEVVYLLATREEFAREKRMDRYEAKFIMVESQPDGNIVFHAAGATTVSEQEWKDNKDALGFALVRAYKNPAITVRYGPPEIHVIKPIPLGYYQTPHL